MLKIVSIVDKTGTALDRLAKMVAPYHTMFEYSVCDVHPKRPDPEQLDRFIAEARNADVVDFQYFRTALMLLERFEWLKDKKLVLTHNNPYSIYEQKWEQFDANVGNNNFITAELERMGAPNVSHIPLTTEAHFWQYNTDWTPNKNIIMVANRIESKKGILPVATAVGNLGYKFILVGDVSDANYMYDIEQTGTVEFYQRITDEKLRELYYNSSLLICNSVDNFESGTLPILEAMQCGVPVLTREVGHVPDIYNGDNLYIMKNNPEDVLAIQDAIEDVFNDKKKMAEVRDTAWNTAKNFNPERRAFLYQRLYRSLFDGEPVSVVVPIYDKPDTIRACLNAIAEQSYPNIELVIVDDSNEHEALVKDFAKTVSMPVNYVQNGRGDYGLARARNKGIIAATGEYICFCDQRMIMEKDAIREFVNNVTPRVWVYGNKGGKKDFVENFSLVRRQDIILAGMFCERITAYGGMSQEVRVRTRLQGITHRYVETAKATPLGKSSNKNRKRDEILGVKNMLFKMDLNQ